MKNLLLLFLLCISATAVFLACSDESQEKPSQDLADADLDTVVDVALDVASDTGEIDLDLMSDQRDSTLPDAADVDASDAVPEVVDPGNCAGVTVYAPPNLETVAVDSETPNACSEDSSNVYTVANREHLDCIANRASLDHTDGVTFIQVADIEVGILEEGDSIGEAVPFKGTYDGNGHALTGIVVENRPQVPAALFAEVQGATIKNLRVEDLTLEGGGPIGFIADATSDTIVQDILFERVSLWGLTNLGTAVGRAESTTLQRIQVRDVTIDSEFGDAGGAAGRLSNSIVRDVFVDVREIRSDTLVAGAVARAEQTDLTNIHVRALMDGATPLYLKDGPAMAAGGVVGVMYPLEGTEPVLMDSVSFVGSIGSFQPGINNIGGVAGSVDSIVISNAFASCEISGLVVGGIAARVSGGSTVIDSYTRGSITGADAIGGLIGLVDGSDLTTIDSSFSAASVGGPSSTTGGLIARSQAPVAVRNSFAVGSLTSADGSILGVDTPESSSFDAVFYDPELTGFGQCTNSNEDPSGCVSETRDSWGDYSESPLDEWSQAPEGPWGPTQDGLPVHCSEIFIDLAE